MDIRNSRRLKKVAVHRLENARDAGKILWIYLSFLFGAAVLVTIVTELLSGQISQSGGLSNLGTRSFLSSVQSFLPIVQNLVMLVVEFGYVAAMLRIARGQFTSPMTMKVGMERFWVLLRAILAQSFIYFAACFAGFQIATIIYSFTPMSTAATQLLMPLMAEYPDPQELVAVMTEAQQMALLDAAVPLLILVPVCCAALIIPISYQFRLVNYILMDKPGWGALRALRESRTIMRGNKLPMFRLDLSFWWYYLLLILASALSFGDLILAALGIPLPFSAEVSYYLFYGLCLAAQLVIYLCLRNRVEVTYALAYESIRPKEPEAAGAVLGNIFQM